MKKKIILAIELFTVCIALSGIVSAFGVSSPYWDDNPLIMAKGSTETVELNLQNMVGDEDVTVKAEVITGNSIAELDKDIYTVKAGTADTIVPLKLHLPEDVIETQEVAVTFKTVTDDEGGAVAMGTGMTTSFDVLVTDKIVGQQTGISSMSLSLILLCAVIILAFAVYRRKTR